ncbi:PEP/pyruvate-binding domain-containing protein [Sphaerochaeta sp. PS]|uniref:PEP/pyruvate-binding domain-containing protein n=1 Tax=Sphaerochaeta sp. PS TaxID=3076336 RepID=UPI0028A3716C|nr:PEP/pyruvate-binding domain-containing protein [Sphaerochaeta sp. PS]MDT4762734.1 PEP/pyruvate-binding domain-containing protein [Sphaerochaeta sp. PS]
MYNLDPTWLPFSNLMLKHIYNVLLICSDYDRFLLEEDGRVEEELYLEYTQLGLNNPPKITHTNTGDEALALVAERSFDLVITMLDLGSDPVEELATAIKKIDPQMPIIVLSPSSSHRRNKLIKDSDCKAIDYFFYWQGDPTIFLAMIKLVEDRMNLDHDTEEADVQVIILVEDSVRFYSSYLPMMYTCLIEQNRSSILEALNNWGKTLRMRGRPKIVLARSYEEAERLYLTYRHNILGIITDLSYLRKGVHDKEAGLELCKMVLAKDAEVPILIQSTDSSYKDKALEAGACYTWKLSSSLLSELNKFMNSHFGFGPFIFRDPSTGKEIARAETMRDLQRLLPSIPEESFDYHCRRNEFSRWLRAQSLYILAAKIKDLQIPEHGDASEVQQQLIDIIRNYRAERTKGVIAQFSRNNYDETLFFSRIGNGSLGGKGRGLAFIDMELRASGILEKYPDVYLSIPRTVVITTDQFTQFIEENELEEIITAALPDETLLKVFLSKPLNAELVLNLAEIVKVIHQPITVRSSSLLEDSHFQPFAGVYETCMLPNQGSEEQRLTELCDALRCVWASTYFRRAKEYLKATDHMLEEEKMAVVIQQVIGSEHGSYWYPNISGVARSLNYYPIGGEKPEDGVGMLCFGFGKSVVDNGSVFRFSPSHPRKPVQHLGGNQSSTQSNFYGLNLEGGYFPLAKEGLENLELLDMQEAEKHPESLRYIASTFDMATGAMSESTRAEGHKIITFNGILKYDAFPLAPIVRDILKLGTEAMRAPIEIEFAVNLNRKAPKKPEFSLLQIRPIAQGNEESDVVITDEEREDAIVLSNVIMGNGKISDIHDIIYIKQETFDPSRMQDMAKELDKLNAAMVLQERDYALIVAGRLGSCDPWLGIPVAWSQISRSKVIVETGFPGFQVEPSQGTHFFQNMTSLGCIYMTVNPIYKAGRLDLQKFSTLPLYAETEHFIHARSEKPLTIKVNGFKGEGVLCL